MRPPLPFACRALGALAVFLFASLAFGAAEKSTPTITVYTNVTVVDGTGAPDAKILNEDF